MIRSDPPGAAVTINGQDYGTSPLEFGEVPSGQYEIVLQVPGYKEFTQVVDVFELRPYVLDISLTKQSSSLKATSVPPGAEVRIDGRLAGNTPLSLDTLDAGDHEIEFILDGYKTLKKPLTSGDSPLITVSVTLEEEMASVDVRSEPTGALVSLDGEQKGSTPLSFQVPMGNYELVLTKDGYESASELLAVEKSTVSQTYTLKAARPSLTPKRLTPPPPLAPSQGLLSTRAAPVGLVTFSEFLSLGLDIRGPIDGTDHGVIAADELQPLVTYTFYQENNSETRFQLGARAQIGLQASGDIAYMPRMPNKWNFGAGFRTDVFTTYFRTEDERPFVIGIDVFPRFLAAYVSQSGNIVEFSIGHFTHLFQWLSAYEVQVDDTNVSTVDSRGIFLSDDLDNPYFPIALNITYYFGLGIPR